MVTYIFPTNQALMWLNWNNVSSSVTWTQLVCVRWTMTFPGQWFKISQMFYYGHRQRILDLFNGKHCMHIKASFCGEKEFSFFTHTLFISLSLSPVLSSTFSPGLMKGELVLLLLVHTCWHQWHFSCSLCVHAIWPVWHYQPTMDIINNNKSAHVIAVQVTLVFCL